MSPAVSVYSIDLLIGCSRFTRLISPNIKTVNATPTKLNNRKNILPRRFELVKYMAEFAYSVEQHSDWVPGRLWSLPIDCLDGPLTNSVHFYFEKYNVKTTALCWKRKPSKIYFWPTILAELLQSGLIYMRSFEEQKSYAN